MVIDPVVVDHAVVEVDHVAIDHGVAVAVVDSAPGTSCVVEAYFPGIAYC